MPSRPRLGELVIQERTQRRNAQRQTQKPISGSCLQTADSAPSSPPPQTTPAPAGPSRGRVPCASQSSPQWEPLGLRITRCRARMRHHPGCQPRQLQRLPTAVQRIFVQSDKHAWVWPALAVISPCRAISSPAAFKARMSSVRRSGPTPTTWIVPEADAVVNPGATT